MASKGVKIALIGCAVIVFGVIIAVVTGGYFLKRAVSSKLETVKNVVGTEDSEYGKKSAELKKEYRFTPPDNGIITENQLNRFLTVRRAIYDIYRSHEAEFKKIDAEKQTFTAMSKLGGVLNEVRMAQIKALTDERMSPDEYSYMVTSIYKTWYAKGWKDALQGKTFQQANSEQLDQSIAAIDQQLQLPNLTDEQKKQLEQTKARLEEQKKGLSQNEGIQKVDAELASVPKENLDLFAKHQKEIEQYSMAGLELIGL